MSFEALARVRDVKAPNATALLLLYILAEFAGPDGCCWPSQSVLKERSQLGLRAIGTNLSRLRKAGLIEQRQRRRRDGSRTSDHFRLLYYTPEQAAETAACEIEKTPRKSKKVEPGDKPQNVRQAKPHLQRHQAAPGAGLTSFEPVTEPITSSERIGCAADAEAPQGLAGPLGAVPPEIRSAFAEHPQGGERFCASWIDICAFDPATRRLHAPSGLAKSKLEDTPWRKVVAEIGVRVGEVIPSAAIQRARATRDAA